MRGASTLTGGIEPPGGGQPRSPAGTGDEQEEPQIQPDRPDITNAAYTVPRNLVQIESGGQRSRVPVSGESMATPVSARIGVANWFEARMDTDGLTRSKQAAGTSTEFGGVTAGGKFRLWAPGSGAPVVAVMPGVTLPWGRTGGGTDYLMRIISGGDLPAHWHLDVNYGVGAIAGEGSHFFQQMASASANVSIGRQWNPYVEAYWVSKSEPDARPTVAIDTGAIYIINPRFSIDGGVAFGLRASANGPSVFGGLSVIVGEVVPGEGVRARMRDAQRRGDR